MLRKLSGGRLSGSSTINSSQGDRTTPEICRCSEALHKVAKATQSSADSCVSVRDSLQAWSERETNSAVRDVNKQTAELMALWAGVQNDFTHQLHIIADNLQRIKDSEKRLTDKEKDVHKLVKHEKKIDKDIKCTQRWGKGGDIRLLQQTRQTALRDRQICERELEEQKSEEQIVRMFRYRQCMQSLSDTYATLASSCHTIFSAQRELCELVPALSTQDPRQMSYEGAPLSSACVQQVRESLLNPNLCSPAAAKNRKDRAEAGGDKLTNQHIASQDGDGRDRRRSAPPVPQALCRVQRTESGQAQAQAQTVRPSHTSTSIMSTPSRAQQPIRVRLPSVKGSTGSGQGHNCESGMMSPPPPYTSAILTPSNSNNRPSYRPPPACPNCGGNAQGQAPNGVLLPPSAPPMTPEPRANGGQPLLRLWHTP